MAGPVLRYPDTRRSRGAISGLLCVAAMVGLGAISSSAGNADGGMVFYGVTSRIRGFDPVKAGDVASADAIAGIYEGLLQYSYLVRPYRLEPCLAESMPPEVSEDGIDKKSLLNRRGHASTGNGVNEHLHG